MPCNTKITAAISNSCAPVKGIKRVWIGNRTELTRTKTNNTVSVALIGAAKLYLATGFKDFANAGADAKVFENLPTGFTNKVMLSLTVGNAAAQMNIDQADDLVVFAEKNDGNIHVYGVDYGVWKTTQSQTANDNKGMQNIEYSTREGMEEAYSVYFSTQTAAQLDAMTV